jgi:hypothetical protein
MRGKVLKGVESLYTLGGQRPRRIVPTWPLPNSVPTRYHDKYMSVPAPVASLSSILSPLISCFRILILADSDCRAAVPSDVAGNGV